MLSGVSFVAAAEEPMALDSIDPPNFYITYDDHINILMVASSRFEIDSIYIDDNKAILKDGVFTVTGLPLILGRNAFIIRLNDTLGNASNYLYTVYRQEPAKEPEASIETPEEPVSSEEVKTQAATDETVKAEPVTTAKEIPVNNESSPAAGGFLTKTSPITAYKNVILADSASDTIVSSPVSSSSVSTSGSQSYVSEESVSSNGALTVVFSSPYDKQVVTENSLKISGSFDPSSGISSITVNGQACSPDFTNNTFTGPMLISPGEARRRGVKSDSSEYIIMDVDSNTHSGKNVLKVLITNDLGRTDKQDSIFYYYQLFVKANTYGESIFTYDDGTTFSLATRNTQSYNKNLFYDPPYSGWSYPEKAYRNENHFTYPYHYDYSDDMKAFYHADNCPGYRPSDYGSSMGVHGRYSVCTKLTLHTPPIKETPFILVLKDCTLFEYMPMFLTSTSQYIPNAISRYLLNGNPIIPMDSLNRYSRSGYALIEGFTPDMDYPVEFQIPKYGGDKGIQTSAFCRTSQYFHVDDITTLTADILLDSDNDGLLGGEDNAYEMVSPGCVFWVNDDDDYNESSVHPDDSSPALASGKADCHDNKINGIRDLEDFMPFNITIPDITEWTNNQNVKFYLKAAGEGKVRVFKRIQDAEKENDLAYLKKLNRSIQQYTEKMKFLLPSDDNKKEGQLLDPSWFDSEGNFYAIFEGAEKGSLKLTLEVELGTDGKKKRVTLDEVVVTLVDVESMFKVYNTRYNSNSGDQEGPTVGNDNLLRYRFIREQEGYGSRFPEDPDRIIIWTHGYNNSIYESLENIETLFKRLYITGFRGGFIGVAWAVHRWQDDFGIMDELSWINFDPDWEKSYRSGHVFADIIRNTKASYPDAKLDLFVHSLGNNVACYALRLLSEKDEQIVDNFILHEAAVPGEVFCGEYGKVEYYGENLRDGFFDNIYSESLGAVKGKVYNTFCIYDIAVATGFPIAGAFGLSTPLDVDYKFANKATKTQISLDYKGLGCSAVDTIFGDKIKSRDQFNHEEKRPSGIKGHGSQTAEYYYDVARFFERVVDLNKMEKDIAY
jgi:hypothetical protein